MLSKTLLLSALAAFAAAQQNVSTVLTFTHVPNPITDGSAQAITYATNDTTTPVTIILRKGPSGHLNTIATLTEKATNGQFIWTPAKSLPDGSDYALEITQGTQFNYFGPFTVQGQSEEASSSSSAYSNSTSMTTAPSTSTMSGTVSAGTGTTMMRNTTMSMATLHTSNTVSSTSTTQTTTQSGAGLQTSAAASQSGNTASDMKTDSALAMIFGAAAAALFL
ncbi:Hypothetical protein R9X50_00052700 [Acrodontium crateriforme]|uniref:Yeast cell wall synthesis Kre9/Knh1-like N-terminal domain-containing protein n=1 Tax=Acrodontium crateriforme TaxID=150365 RepID=A0AAQ3LXF0_9PEZI|nr:Hypothetical protein R9X50_00052700 [Acrodontium crateriforme]